MMHNIGAAMANIPTEMHRPLTISKRLGDLSHNTVKNNLIEVEGLVQMLKETHEVERMENIEDNPQLRLEALIRNAKQYSKMAKNFNRLKRTKKSEPQETIPCIVTPKTLKSDYVSCVLHAVPSPQEIASRIRIVLGNHSIEEVRRSIFIKKNSLYKRNIGLHMQELRENQIQVMLRFELELKNSAACTNKCFPEKIEKVIMSLLSRIGFIASSFSGPSDGFDDILEKCVAIPYFDFFPGTVENIYEKFSREIPEQFRKGAPLKAVYVLPVFETPTKKKIDLSDESDSDSVQETPVPSAESVLCPMNLTTVARSMREKKILSAGVWKKKKELIVRKRSVKIRKTPEGSCNRPIDINKVNSPIKISSLNSPTKKGRENYIDAPETPNAKRKLVIEMTPEKDKSNDDDWFRVIQETPEKLQGRSE